MYCIVLYYVVLCDCETPSLSYNFLVLKTSAGPQPGGSALCAMISVTILHTFHIAHRTKAIRWMDERVKVMNEIIAGMRVIKMYTWEDSFSKWIRQIRRLDK